MPTGESGRIFVRSDLLFDGYTGGGSKPIVDGLMGTGDTGHFDDDGRLFVDGREDEMIVSGGENVFPREVEDLLTSRADVVEAAVDRRPRRRVRAAPEGVRRARHRVRPSTPTTVRDYVKENLARFKVPRDVEFVDELPRNATGKVVKRALQA